MSSKEDVLSDSPIATVDFDNNHTVKKVEDPEVQREGSTKALLEAPIEAPTKALVEASPEAPNETQPEPSSGVSQRNLSSGSMETVSIRSASSPDALLHEQAQKLFGVCDVDKRGFVVKMDLDRISEYISAADLENLSSKLEETNKKYLDEAAFVKSIEPFLVNPTNDGCEEKDPSHPLHQELFQTGHCSLADELAVVGMEDRRVEERARGEERQQTTRAYMQREIYPFTVENKSPMQETKAFAPTIIKKDKFRPLMPDPYDPNSVFSPAQSLADELSEVENGGPPSRIPPELDMRAPDRIFKVVFVGDSAVGKTCFLHRFCHNRFKPLFNATIGVDFTVKTVQLRDRLIAVQLWDTAGQERFRSITKQYFRKADGVVLMYDVTSEQSFLHVRNWIDSVKAGVEDNVVMCLVGNKVDLFANEQARSLTYRAGRQIAQEFGMLFFETSAFTGYGINECMMAMAESLQYREDQHLEEALKLEMEVDHKMRSWCCL